MGVLVPGVLHLYMVSASLSYFYVWSGGALKYEIWSLGHRF